jgi:hypothetical protein
MVDKEGNAQPQAHFEPRYTPDVFRLKPQLSRYSDRLWVGRLGFDSRQDQIFLHSVETGSGAHPVSYPRSRWILSLGVKRCVYKVAHSPLCSAEVKSGGVIPPLPAFVYMKWWLVN